MHAVAGASAMLTQEHACVCQNIRGAIAQFAIQASTAPADSTLQSVCLVLATGLRFVPIAGRALMTPQHPGGTHAYQRQPKHLPWAMALASAAIQHSEAWMHRIVQLVQRVSARWAPRRSSLLMGFRLAHPATQAATGPMAWSSVRSAQWVGLHLRRAQSNVSGVLPANILLKQGA